MKKLLFSFVLILSTISIPVQAANQVEREILKFGIQGGSIFSQLKNMKTETDSYWQKLAIRFHAGVFVEYKFIEALGLRLNLSYVGQGYRDQNKDASTKIKANFDYITSAVSFRYYTDPERKSCIFLGPYVGYLLAAKIHVKNEGTNNTVDLMKDDQFKEKGEKFDFGVVFGSDYEFDQGFTLGSTAHMGFISIEKEEKYRNLGLDITLGYNFAKLL